MKKTVLLAGIASILFFAMLSCTNPAGGANGVDRAALESAIATAQTLLAQTEESADGADVHENRYWISAVQRDNFRNAITSALDVLDNAATQAEIDAETTTLNNMAGAFQLFRQAGTLSLDQVAYAGLRTARSDANALISVAVIAEDGFAVQAGVQWVPQTANNAFSAAIAASNLEGSGADQQRVDDAVFVLRAAIATFYGAIRVGEPGDIRIHDGELILRGRVYYQGQDNLVMAQGTVAAHNIDGQVLASGGEVSDGYLHIRVPSPSSSYTKPLLDIMKLFFGEAIALAINFSDPDVQAALIGSPQDDEDAPWDWDAGLRITTGSDNNGIFRGNIEDTSEVDFLYVANPVTFSHPAVPNESAAVYVALSAGWNLLLYRYIDGLHHITLTDASLDSYANVNTRWFRN